MEERETRPGGRAGMCPWQRLATENVGQTMYWPYVPTGAVSHDDDDDDDDDVRELATSQERQLLKIITTVHYVLKLTRVRLCKEEGVR